MGTAKQTANKKKAGKSLHKVRFKANVNFHCIDCPYFIAIYAETYRCGMRLVYINLTSSPPFIKKSVPLHSISSHTFLTNLYE
jgi:hypothetical protein